MAKIKWQNLMRDLSNSNLSISNNNLSINLTF